MDDLKPMPRRAAFFLGALLAGLWAAGSAGAEEESPFLPPASAVQSSTAPAAPAYIYRGDRLRDPFIPLTGGPGGGTMAPVATETGPFDPQKLELKGILRTPTGRWALLRTTEGVPYMVQNGKVYDPKRKAVAGYQAIVKEKGVILLGPNNSELEILLKKDEPAAP